MLVSPVSEKAPHLQHTGDAKKTVLRLGGSQVQACNCFAIKMSTC